MKRIFALSALLLALGCGKSDSSTDTDSAEDTSSTSCTRSGYAINDAYGDLEEGGEEGWVVTAENWDLSSGLMIESWSEYDGPTEAGVYDLAGTNYEDCALCLLICYQFDGERCESFFYADEGTVEIERIDVSEGGEVELSLSGVVFKEVTINNYFVSTPVEDGETWCVDSEESISASFAVEEEEDWAGDDLVGEALPDLTAPDQAGNEVTLSSLQGTMLAILFNANSWCPYCVNEAKESEALWQEMTSEDDRYDVSYVQILYDDASYESPATQEDALAWATEYGITHPVLHGESASAYFDASGVGAFPCYWIADPLGQLRDAVCGEGQVTSALMLEHFETFLTENPTWTRD